MKTYTQEEAAELHKQRDALASCVTWAVNFMKTPGGGCVMHWNEDRTDFTSESWLSWFRRELKAVGIEWDDDLLEYHRASKTDRKRMLKENPTLVAKLEERAKKRAEQQAALSKPDGQESKP